MAGSSLCKHHQGDTTNSEDKISKLPDAALVEILSLLTIKEAGRSSVLSHRWRNLWKSTTRLDFGVPLEELLAVRRTMPKEIIQTSRSKYVTWVNQVLRLHECRSLDEFIVSFDLDASYNEDINEWIKFMILNRAKRMEISFPLIGTNFYSLSQEQYDFIKSESNLSNIMCLRSLTLCAVDVDGELIEYLLSKCPHLEMISLSFSHKLFRLKVAGPSLPLKCLKIWGCDSLESFELCAPKLLTFYYSGKPTNLIIGRNPLLSDLSIGGGYDMNTVTRCLPLFSSYYSQIVTLSLTIFSYQDYVELPEVSGLRNLKHLICTIFSRNDRSLMGLTKLIMVAPCLQKLSLELDVAFPLRVMPLGDPPPIQRHEGLKEVEISGFVGCRNQFELAMYLVKSAFNLEKMLLDQHSPDLFDDQGRKESAKLVAEQAEELTGCLPPRAELIIL